MIQQPITADVQTAVSNSVRILVADDNSVDRMYLSSILRKEGYEVLQAVNGQDAVEQFENHRPEIVLLDVIMPEMRRARACCPGSPWP